MKTVFFLNYLTIVRFKLVGSEGLLFIYFMGTSFTKAHQPQGHVALPSKGLTGTLQNLGCRAGGFKYPAHDGYGFMQTRKSATPITAPSTAN